MKAPIVADGDVQGRQADFVIDLDVDLDPAEQGIALQRGDRVRVTLPAGFRFDDGALAEFPVCSLGENCGSVLNAACVPGTLACSTVVFLRGYPQSPVPPDVSRDGNTLVLTARDNTGPVVKQIHIIGKAIISPRAGRYRIAVEHRDAGGGLVDRGSGKLRVLRAIRPSINVTSVFASLSPGGGPPPPVARYEFRFDVGPDPVPGRYTTTLRLRKGNAVQMFVDVPGAPGEEEDRDEDDDRDKGRDDD